ncbi:MAG: cell division protein FtsA [Oceanibaculum nanhaiense]|uniref:cell division protein FtsA n=1 Tax=Oceanibaculum nanhaiense TaxID=1909734 RepID=UPI0025A390CD|nr:cell division protein FtsA [Oceanibaculum nanhaiense]MDM7947263.1 cell division protein FtsA [Oceanibaculum nanhaiense]
MSKSLTKPRTGLVAALDIGTTKIACFIARIDHGVPRVVGIGHQFSRGLRSGAIVDMEAAEESILNAVHAAEKMANETVRQVVVNVSGGHPASHTIGVEVALGGQEIGERDVRRVLSQGRTQQEPEDRQLIHSIPIGFSIDGSRGIKDPRGMFGQRLGADIHVVTAQAGVLRNLTTVVQRCHLDIEALVVSPYASGLAALVEDEMELGVTVIDMGGGTTTVAVFFEGQVVFTDMVPIGGGHVTSDIARGLTTPLAEAERMKTLYGSAISSPLDDREVIDVPLVGEDRHTSPNHVPKSFLVSIIQPRLEETFEHVRSRLEISGFDKLAGRRVVLTGGASQLPGVRDMAQLVLDKQVRMGRPIRAHGLADSTGGPAFATCAGLLTYAVNEQIDVALLKRGDNEAPAGLMGRIGSWLRENF